MHDIFLSYSRDDQAIARRFAEAFEHAGFSVWWDVALKSGIDYDQATEQALRSAKAVVVLWSKKSVDSRWVRTEATVALQNKTLVPVSIEVCQRPIMFELSQTADLTQWKGDDKDTAWLNFVAELRHHIDHGHDAPAPTRVSTTAKARNNTVVLSGIAFAAVVVLGVAFWFMRSAPPSSPAPAATAIADATANALDPNTIAVLPFTNISPNANDAYFATGLHEEILNQLAKVSKLKVISRQSVLRYSGSQLSIPAIAKELRVHTIMEGSVRYAGNRIRITAQLINAMTDEQLWSQTFDEDFNDVFAIESQVAMQVANAMKVSFSKEEAAQIASIPTKSPEAYALYLQTLGDISFAGQTLLENTLVLLDRALVLDPGFVKAHRRKGLVYEYQNNYEKALATYRRAEELAPSVEGAEYLRYYEMLLQNRLTEAAGLAEARVKRQPDDLIALQELRELLMRMGNNEAALNYALHFAEISPNSTNNLTRSGVLYSRFGRYKEALQMLERALQLQPKNNTVQVEMSDVLSALGRKSEALNWLRSAELLTVGADAQDGNPLGISALIFGYSLAGSTKDAERLFARFKTMEMQADLVSRARAHLGAGDYNITLTLMQQLSQEKPTLNGANAMAYQQLRDNPYKVEVLNRPEFVKARSNL